MTDVCPFILDNNDILIDVSILTYPVFKRVYDSDRTPKKDYAHKYFTYIYHSSSQRCVPAKRGFSKNETKEYCNLIAKFSTNTPVDYKLLDEAIAFYKATFILPIEEHTNNLKSAIRQNTKITTKIKDRVDDVLDQETKMSTEQISEFIKLQEKLIDIAEQLPKQIKLIQEAEQMVLEALSNKKQLRGKTELKASMTGDSEIETE